MPNDAKQKRRLYGVSISKVTLFYYSPTNTALCNGIIERIYLDFGKTGWRK